MTTFLAAGNILFGHFQEHKAKRRRLLKVALFAGVTAGCSSFGLRWVGWTLIGAAIVGAGYLHLLWLPSHGINGWTGEPKEKCTNHPLRDKTGNEKFPRSLGGWV